MNWDSLYQMQKNLDQYIKEKQQLSVESKVEEKVLALLVELGELANETRCFKFWSTKQASEKNVILEEYVDGLHFLLSLGLDLDYKYQPTDVKGLDSQVEAFLYVYQEVNTFRSESNNQNYQSLFKSYLMLGRTLGFVEEEWISSYYKKNEVNFDRQDQGY